jgi:SHS2 domain-containing protein
MNDDHAVANPQPVFEFPGTAGCRITAWPEAKVPVWAHWRSVLVIARAAWCTLESCTPARPGRRRAVAGQGYRTVPHTADLRIEAWAQSRNECVTEALRGLIASFADISEVQPARILERLMTAGSDADLLAAAADEVIYILDAEGEIPVSVQVRPAGAGIVVVLALARAECVEITGAVPKAVSFHELRCEPDPTGRWSASMTIDV